MDSRIFQKQCRSLVNKGFDTTLIVLNGKSENIDGVKIISLDFAFQSRLKRILFASKKIFDTAVDIKADIYHLHDPEITNPNIITQKFIGQMDESWIYSKLLNMIEV